MVVKQMLEPQLEPIFDQDSYGYRPGKSAHQAVESCRKRLCVKFCKFSRALPMVSADTYSAICGVSLTANTKAADHLQAESERSPHSTLASHLFTHSL